MNRGVFKKSGGYTLLEMVIYSAILAVIAVLMVGLILSVYRSFGHMRVERRIASNGNTAMETILRTVQSATSTDLSASEFGLNPGVLKATSTTFSLSGAVLQSQKEGQKASDITSSGVSVTNLVFYRTATSTPSRDQEVIKIEMTLEAGSGEFYKTMNFLGSAVLRGRY